jgi:hypothetical protein
MTISDTALKILESLTRVVQQISPSDYIRRSEVLGGATIGQHVRHTIEFFQCLEHGCHTGIVNYDQRRRDVTIESDRSCALRQIMLVREFIGSVTKTVHLTLEVCYDSGSEDYVAVETNTIRELVYNVEHAVHHMAMIKIAVRDIAPYIELEEDFGIAASTARYTRLASH